MLALALEKPKTFFAFETAAFAPLMSSTTHDEAPSSSLKLPFTIGASFYASIVCVIVYAALALLGFSLLLRNFLSTRASFERIARIKSNLIKSRVRARSHSGSSSQLSPTRPVSALSAAAAAGATAAAAATAGASGNAVPVKNSPPLRKGTRFTSLFVSNADDSDDQEARSDNEGEEDEDNDAEAFFEPRDEADSDPSLTNEELHSQ
jgi:hypothetical protein